MRWEEKPLSQAALDDEAEHSEFLRKVALDLAGQSPPPHESPPPAPQPKYVTQAELQRALGGLSQTIGKAVARMVVEPLEKRIERLEAKGEFLDEN